MTSFTPWEMLTPKTQARFGGVKGYHANIDELNRAWMMPGGFSKWLEENPNFDRGTKPPPWRGEENPNTFDARGVDPRPPERKWNPTLTINPAAAQVAATQAAADEQLKARWAVELQQQQHALNKNKESNRTRVTDRKKKQTSISPQLQINPLT